MDGIPDIDKLNEIMIDEKPKEEKKDLDVLKDLFNKKDIETKTELTGKQVILINQKRTIAGLIGFQKLNDCLNDFMVLMISKDRKGRMEFVDGFKANREHEQNMAGGGFFSGIKERLK